MDSAAALADSIRPLAEPMLAYHMLAVAWERFACGPPALTDSQRREARQIALRTLLIENAVLHSPEAVGVFVPPQQVEASMEQIRARYRDPSGRLDETALLLELEDSGLNESGLQAALQRQLRVEAILDRVASAAMCVGDTEVRLYYYMHLDEFKYPEKRIARHILITVNEAMAENTRQQALARITAIAERLQRKPERFAEQALKHSECPTSLQGGLLGTVARGVLYPELEARLFALRSGGISPVVESELGFHVLWCERIIPAHTATAEEVLPTLREKLQRRQGQIEKRRWLRNLLTGDGEVLAAATVPGRLNNG